MRRLIAEAGLPPIEFEFGTFFTAMFRRPEKRRKAEISADEMKKFGIKFGIKGSRLRRISDILHTLYQGEVLSIADFAVKAGVSTRAIEKDIEFLKEQDIITFQGPRKTGRYILTERGKKVFEEM